MPTSSYTVALPVASFNGIVDALVPLHCRRCACDTVWLFL